jgi:hypothetical protein
MNMHVPIDHVVILVPDLYAAGSAFEAAGFQVTPQTRHSPAMGTANRCVMLQGGTYLEIMGIVAETPANAPWRRLLSNAAGIRGFALRSSDIEVSVQQLVSRGIAAEPVRHFSRVTNDGELRFSITRIDPPATPGLQCLVCQHHTADLLWRPETMVHPNGAASLISVALPHASSLSAFASDESLEAIAVAVGADRLTFAGRQRQYHDLRSVCGVEIEVFSA